MESRGVKRKTVSVRLEAIDRIKNGERVKDVAKEYNVSSQSVRNWLKQKDKIEETAERSGPSAISCEDISHALALRRAVYDWFQERALPMSAPLIASKAIELNAAMGGPADFKASNGWIHKFKKAFAIHKLNMTGETRSATTDATDTYRAKLHSIIKGKSLTPDQIYNADESGLYIKCMPNTMKEDKSRITILFCSNATGDHKLPLLILGKSANSHAFSKVNREKLPAVYSYSKKAWMTAKIFEAWVRGQFEPRAKEYLRLKGLPLRALLIVDNASSHNLPQKTIGIVTIEFLPPNVTSLIQPMEQGAIALFMRRYRLELVRRLVKALDPDAELRKISVLVALKLSAGAWDEIKSETLAKCWKPIGLHVQRPDSPTTVQSIEQILEDELIHYAQKLPGLESLNHEQVVEWCESDLQDVSDDISGEEYEFLNPDRVFESDSRLCLSDSRVFISDSRLSISDSRLSISHEEGVAALDRACLYAKQFPEFANYMETLMKVRNEAVEYVQQYRSTSHSPQFVDCSQPPEQENRIKVEKLSDEEQQFFDEPIKVEYPVDSYEWNKDRKKCQLLEESISVGDEDSTCKDLNLPQGRLASSSQKHDVEALTENCVSTPDISADLYNWYQRERYDDL